MVGVGKGQKWMGEARLRQGIKKLYYYFVWNRKSGKL